MRSPRDRNIETVVRVSPRRLTAREAIGAFPWLALAGMLAALLA